MAVDAGGRRWSLPWYALVAVVVVPLLGCVGVLILSLRINERSVDRERVARQASEQALCQVWVVLDDAYSSGPTVPTTPLGRQLAAAIENMRSVNHCTPRSR